MPISFACRCGRSLRVKEELAGKQVRCPKCHAALDVPKQAPSEDEEVIDLLMDEPQEEDGDEQTALQAELPSGKADGPRKPAPLKPRRRQRQRLVLTEEELTRPGPINAGSVGGFLLILLAVGWFSFGLFAGVIFFYPPVLLLIGLFALIKGIRAASE
jgi:hypothetical protein